MVAILVHVQYMVLLESQSTLKIVITNVYCLTKSVFRITANSFCSKMKGRWKIIIILLVFVVKNKGDTLNELLISVKNLHDKVDKIGMEQVKTHEKVEQLQTKLNQLSLNVMSMPEMDFNEKIATTTSSLKTLNNKGSPKKTAYSKTL